ncbi:hypothetical protein SAMN05216326_1559 [Nitrosomonas marina]|uniref:Uncharacterized protein n=1 Tax=Nitrosomonas marina TaxID=917 RepID=A0A1I0G5M4_9PROT|nr:hypothetical protein [Nitrosomonas marina]SET66228.1 hypothetical protein SAMN05216326_1559 [Nitrosomonas marina]
MPGLRVACQILKRIAVHDYGLPLERLRAQCSADLLEENFRNVLNTLAHDSHLIELGNGNIAFFSHLFRDYWRHKGVSDMEHEIREAPLNLYNPASKDAGALLENLSTARNCLHGYWGLL